MRSSAEPLTGQLECAAALAKINFRWRTALIVRELEEEVWLYPACSAADSASSTPSTTVLKHQQHRHTSAVRPGAGTDAGAAPPQRAEGAHEQEGDRGRPPQPAAVRTLPAGRPAVADSSPVRGYAHPRQRAGCLVHIRPHSGHRAPCAGSSGSGRHTRACQPASAAARSPRRWRSCWCCLIIWTKSSVSYLSAKVCLQWRSQH